MNKKFQKFHISIKALIKVQNEFLIIFEPKNSNYPDFVDLPGGRVDENEIFEEVLTRELKEEIGLILNISELNVFEVIQRYKYSFFDNEGFCLCEIINLIELDKKPELVLSKEHANYCWVNKNTNLDSFKFKIKKQKELITKFQQEYCN